MKTSQKVTPSKESQILLESLQKAVAQTLEKKRRLGQYAVIWKDGKPAVMGEDEQNSTESST
ncbi:MAG: hypothetical protein PF441_05655 [Desulfuromusa sp.]|jgi:hypothetical protein|nr:hypothetical protein [Desulfuromusa sp.]